MSKNRILCNGRHKSLAEKIPEPRKLYTLICDEDEFVEDHQSKINSVAIFLT